MTGPRQYREALGLTVEGAAKRARICTTYLKRIEKRGGGSFALIERLSVIYEAPMDAFIRRS